MFLSSAAMNVILAYDLISQRVKRLPLEYKMNEIPPELPEDKHLILY